MASIAAVGELHRAAACFYGLLSVLQIPLSAFVDARCEAAPPLPQEAANKCKNVVKAGLKGKLEFVSSFWKTHFSAVAPRSLLVDLKILLQIVDKTKYSAKNDLATYLRGIAAVERLLVVVEADAEAIEAARTIKDALLMDHVEDVVVFKSLRQTGSLSLVEDDKEGCSVEGNEPITTTQDPVVDAIQHGGSQLQSCPDAPVSAESEDSEGLDAVKSFARPHSDYDDEVHEAKNQNEEGNETKAPITSSVVVNAESSRLGVVVPPPISPQLQAVMAIESKKSRRKALVRFAQELMATRMEAQDDVNYILTKALALANSKQQRLGILLHRMEWWMRCRERDLARQDALAAMSLLIAKKIKKVEPVRRLGAGLAAVEEWNAAAEVYQHGLSKFPRDWQLKAGQRAVLLKMTGSEAATRRETEQEGLDLAKLRDDSHTHDSDPFSSVSDDLEDEPLPICRRPRKPIIVTTAPDLAIEAIPERIVETQLSDGFVEWAPSKSEVKTEESHVMPSPHYHEYPHKKETPTATHTDEKDVVVGQTVGQNPISTGSERREILEHVTCELVEMRLHRGVSTSQSARRVIMEMLSHALDLATADHERCEVFTLSAECQLAFGFRKAALADATAALECNEATVPVATRLAQFYGGIEFWEEAEKACILGLSRTPDDKALLELRERMIEEATSWANDTEIATSTSFEVRDRDFDDEEEEEANVTGATQECREGVAEARRTELDAEAVSLLETRLRVIMKMKAVTERQKELVGHAVQLKAGNEERFVFCWRLWPLRARKNSVSRCCFF